METTSTLTNRVHAQNAHRRSDSLVHCETSTESTESTWKMPKTNHKNSCYGWLNSLKDFRWGIRIWLSWCNAKCKNQTQKNVWKLQVSFIIEWRWINEIISHIITITFSPTAHSYDLLDTCWEPRQIREKFYESICFTNRFVLIALQLKISGTRAKKFSLTAFRKVSLLRHCDTSELEWKWDNAKQFLIS